MLCDIRLCTHRYAKWSNTHLSFLFKTCCLFLIKCYLILIIEMCQFLIADKSLREVLERVHSSDIPQVRYLLWEAPPLKASATSSTSRGTSLSFNTGGYGDFSIQSKVLKVRSEVLLCVRQDCVVGFESFAFPQYTLGSACQFLQKDILVFA